MVGKRKHTELQDLESYRLVFTNLSEVANIQAEMADYGYDETVINEGRKLYEKAKTFYDIRQTSSAKENQTYDVFFASFSEMKEQYRKDRKRAKVALLKVIDFYEPFLLKKAMSRAYLPLVNEATEFYTQMQLNPKAKPYLLRFKLTEELATAQLLKIEEVIELRAKYEKAKGESQQATKNKNKAFEDIAEWMRDFFIVAKVALEEHPQLLECIGKFVRS